MTEQVQCFLDEMKGDVSRRVGYATFYKKNVFKVCYIMNVESLVSNTCCRTNLNTYWRRRSQPLWWLHQRRRKAIVHFQPLPRVSQTTLLSLRVLHRLQPVKSPIVGGVALQWRGINGAGALLSPVRNYDHFSHRPTFPTFWLLNPWVFTMGFILVLSHRHLSSG